MRFVHIADLHLDSPFTILTDKLDIGEQRRVEQCIAFKNVIEYIKENQIDYLFISGDLYENEYIKKSTLEYIKELFVEISDTKVFISPGNHDPYIKGAPYEIEDFPSNVYIFKSNLLERYEDENVVIYGSAFTDFYRNNNPIGDTIRIDESKTNILLLHCDLNGAKNKNEMGYLPVNESELKALKFDYCALGHIHKKYVSEDNSIVYPGSLISFGFDELGEHGMIVGEINKHNIHTKFVRIDNREFVEAQVDITGFGGLVKVIEYLNEQKYVDINFYRIILVGKRDWEMDTNTIKNSLEIPNILKIIDLTKRYYNINQISGEQNLKGAFVRRVLALRNENMITQEQMDEMIEIGLDAMN